MTEIPYADTIWEPIGGCTHCSPGCKNCWAEWLVATRLRGNPRYDGLIEYGRWWTGKIKLFEDRLEQPLHWRRPRRIFVCSQADLFNEKVPGEFIFKVIHTAHQSHWHKFLFFTKRVERMAEFFKVYYSSLKMSLPDEEHKKRIPIPNIQLFVSISTQAEADEKIPILLQIPAAVKGISLEPLLEDIDLRLLEGHDIKATSVMTGKPCIRNLDTGATLGQVIIGAESINGRPGRPCKLEWVRNVVQQCQAAGVAVYVKQLIINGELVRDMSKFPKDLRVRQLVKGE